jgi:hypothetical protein
MNSSRIKNIIIAVLLIVILAMVVFGFNDKDDNISPDGEYGLWFNEKANTLLIKKPKTGYIQKPRIEGWEDTTFEVSMDSNAEYWAIHSESRDVLGLLDEEGFMLLDWLK